MRFEEPKKKTKKKTQIRFNLKKMTIYVFLKNEKERSFELESRSKLD